jgi:hypothetical protein
MRAGYCGSRISVSPYQAIPDISAVALAARPLSGMGVMAISAGGVDDGSAAAAVAGEGVVGANAAGRAMQPAHKTIPSSSAAARRFDQR